MGATRNPATEGSHIKESIMNERNTDIHTLLNEVFEHATHTAEPETFYIPLTELESACTDSSTRDTLACTCAKWIMAQPELEIQSALLKGFLYLDIQKQPTNPCRGKSLARPVFQHLLLQVLEQDRKSTRLNSSHSQISY